MPGHHILTLCVGVRPGALYACASLQNRKQTDDGSVVGKTEMTTAEGAELKRLTQGYVTGAIAAWITIRLVDAWERRRERRRDSGVYLG